MLSRTPVAMTSAVVLGATRDPPADFACIICAARGISPTMSNRADQIVSLWRRSV